MLKAVESAFESAFESAAESAADPLLTLNRVMVSLKDSCIEVMRFYNRSDI